MQDVGLVMSMHA